ncbi:hypothetical protein [Paenibacillus radicis (ex Xue et al. 2023)]|uniref:Replicative helicase inhibitor G39P N-terminal domain-containing protein n=1 Tax=Paenibacillus radicis (ex Xue et al. 2023) TaxID=2972489 RepID=A0ABT1YRH2_9BACL|nr:hypothetical protein [Paenibacillus radicis (ex Xue et al. 2023)]MCR8635769.1 hypothetical protein [Paenibacillus radicis (ex Xue et al. 2023)]
MKVSEVIELFEQIKVRYDNFSSSKEKRQAWYEDGLKDVPFDTALANLQAHHATVEKWAPTLAELSRPLVEDQRHTELRATTEEYFRELNEWPITAVTPPDHIKERMRQLAARRTLKSIMES